MLNGAIYDAFQSIDRTHVPFLYTPKTLNASLEAAVHQAARDLLVDCYAKPSEQGMIQQAYNDRMSLVPNGPAKTNGMALGAAIAQQYLNARTNDGSLNMAPWPEGTLPGEWRSDPLHAPQIAWGPVWGAVQPFVLNHSGQFALPGPPAFNSPEYVAAFNQVKQYGALSSPARDALPGATEIGLFWAYDRPTMGPPPVLFVRNLEDIAAAIGTTPAENARLFALASMAMADAAIAAWDAKFAANFWRPITAIRADATYDDDNPATVEDPNWIPLGAPGPSPLDWTDDFTPPFPAYISGHATMGGALFKAIEQFFGTNDFAAADANHGIDLVEASYNLTSEEFGANSLPGMVRSYVRFTQDYTSGPLELGNENSPEGENGTSRVYLGIHWMFDQRDGIALGNQIADYVFNHRFQVVPEPNAAALALWAAIGCRRIARRRRK